MPLAVELLQAAAASPKKTAKRPAGPGRPKKNEKTKKPKKTKKTAKRPARSQGSEARSHDEDPPKKKKRMQLRMLRARILNSYGGLDGTMLMEWEEVHFLNV